MASAKLPGPECLNSPSRKHMEGVAGKGGEGQGYPAAETLGLERNPLLDAIMKLRTIESPFAGLGVLEGERGNHGY